MKHPLFLFMAYLIIIVIFINFILHLNSIAVSSQT